MESKWWCIHPNITINGEPLPREGHGSIALDNGDTVEANWNFGCVTMHARPDEQVMNLRIESVNTKFIPGLDFAIYFRQTVPITIYDIEGPATMVQRFGTGNRNSKPSDGGPTEREMEDDLKEELAKLEFLRSKKHEIQQLIHSKEQRLTDVFGLFPEDTHMPKCHGHKCGPPHPPPPPGHHHGHGGMHGGPPGAIHLIKVVVVPILVMVFVASIVIRCVRWRRSRVARRKARNARRECRRAKLRAFGTRLYEIYHRRGRRPSGGSAEQGQKQEKEGMLRPQGYVDDDHFSVSGRSESTMEEELASCKVAADMVGDMVAAEEGRAQRAVGQRNGRLSQGRVVAAPLSPTDVFGVFVSAGDVPPAYDASVSEGSSSVIADGIRQGSSAYTPSSAGSQDSWEEVGHDTKG